MRRHEREALLLAYGNYVAPGMLTTPDGQVMHVREYMSVGER